VTGEVWIGLEQNVIDAAINERRKCLRAEPMFVANISNIFVGSQKMQLNKLLAKMMKLCTNVCFVFCYD